jgi:hypothetical protein
MVDEVKRLRSLIALANSGRRMKELESSMEESEPIATQIIRVRNRARERQKKADSAKRKEKKEKFEMMLQKIPRRNIQVKAALSTTSTITATPTITAAAATTTALIAATTAEPTSSSLVPQHHTVVIVDDSPAYTARLRRLLQRVFYGGVNGQEESGVKVITFAGQCLFGLLVLVLVLVLDDLLSVSPNTVTNVLSLSLFLSLFLFLFLFFRLGDCRVPLANERCLLCLFRQYLSQHDSNRTGAFTQSHAALSTAHHLDEWQ